MTKTETINLEPNYPAVHANFARALPGESDRLLRELKRNLRPEDAPPTDLLEPVELSQVWKQADDTFHAFHSWLAPLVIALESATTTEEIQKLRQHLHDFLAKVASVSRDTYER